MTKRTFVALCGALALVACKGDDGENPDTDTDTTGCGVTVSNQFPSDGATGVYYRTSLEWDFSEADTTATVTLSAGGTDVAGSGEWVDSLYIWTPSSPLDPSTTYDVNLTWCGGSSDTTFTTSAVGAVVPDADLTDAAYVLDIASGRFVQPAGVGALLQQQLTVDILIGVVDIAGTTLTLQGALGEEGVTPAAQDLCTESIDFPSANFSENPYFEVGPQNTTLEVQGISITIDDLFVSGAFSPDGGEISGAVLAGSIDTRPLVDLVSPGGGPEAVCELVQTFGIACEACAGGGDFCLSLLVDQIAATEVAGLTVVTRTAADVAQDPNCQ
ncbi:MAG: Ig-like domain-containing protein [Myxococcota bacterium]